MRISPTRYRCTATGSDRRRLTRTGENPTGIGFGESIGEQEELVQS